jgi:hypothetical protein
MILAVYTASPSHCSDFPIACWALRALITSGSPDAISDHNMEFYIANLQKAVDREAKPSDRTGTSGSQWRFYGGESRPAYKIYPSIPTPKSRSSLWFLVDPG